MKIEPLPGEQALETLWRELEKHAEHSFFLSWPWIRTWLACLPAHIAPILVTVSDDGMLVAAGLVVRRTTRRLGVITSRKWILHATGDTKIDLIFIEHNNLLVRKGYEQRAWRQLAQYLTSIRDEWDELSLSGVPPHILDAWEGSPLKVSPAMVSPARFVNLQNVRDAGNAFASLLGHHTRRNVKATYQALRRRGPIVADVARTTAEAQEFLKQLTVYHRRRWQGRSAAFGNPFFDHFHEQLVARHFDDGAIQLFRVRAGRHVAGLLYNFVHRGLVYNYQNGFDYSLIHRNESPGILTHSLAIEYNAAQGHVCYDFMAGGGQYKRSLASDSLDLWWGAVQCDCLKFRLERVLKGGWRTLRQRRLLKSAIQVTDRAALLRKK